MASAAFTINGSQGSATVAAGGAVTLALTSASGVGVVEWTIVGGSDSSKTAPTITSSGSPPGATATFTMNGVVDAALGLTWVVQCRVNSGVDNNGQQVAAYTATGIVSVVNGIGIAPFAFGESFERGNNGIADDLNYALAHASTGSITTSAAGIGTLSSPGILRGITGSSTIPALHVGGFWSLQDAGGGSFFWNSSDTRTDDGGTIIRPTAVGSGSPGRWNRIMSGQMPAPIEWFGAKGDGVKLGTSTTGTDDADALEAAIAWSKANGSRKIVLDASKAYIIKRQIVGFDSTEGCALVCEGGFRYQVGAWVRFIGTMYGPLVAARSTNGFRLNGIQFDAINVTMPAADFTYADVATMNASVHTSGDIGKYAAVTGTDYTYANAAARTASAHVVGDIGKTATQTDTGTTWVIISVDSSGTRWAHTSMRWRLATTAPLWIPFETSIIGLHHKNWGGYEGTVGSDTFNARIENCAFSGHSGIGTHGVSRGIMLGGGFNHWITGCSFISLDVGVSGTDRTWGGDFSHIQHIVNNTFKFCDDAAIFYPGNAWQIIGQTFEGDTAGNAGKIWDPNVGGIHYALTIAGNYWSDGSTDTAIILNGRRGASIRGNNILGTTGVFLSSCYGVVAEANAFFSTTAYSIDSSGSTLVDSKLGPDYLTSGVTFLVGTNYSRTTIHNGVGFSWGSGLASGLLAVAFGGSSASGANAFAAGDLNTASAVASTALGSRSVAGISCQLAVGGGNVLGQGGSQWSVVPLTKIVSTATNPELPNSAGTTPSIPGSNRRSYTMIGTYIASDEGTGPTKAYSAQLRVSAQQSSTGVMAIRSQTVTWSDDPATTGCTVDAVVSGSGVSFRFSNASGVTMNVVCSVQIVEAAT